MNQLQVINKNGRLIVDSRDVAEMIGKNHADLLRDIRRYMEVLGKSNFALADFFIETYYNDAQGKPRLHFFLTRKGCDMVANKMTGEKGVLFTATYVTKFEEMEKQITHPEQPKTQAELIAMMAQLNVEQEKRLAQVEQENQTMKHRLDNLDKIDTIGDLQQRLNKMVQRYAWESGANMGTAWKHFDQAFNTAYRTNLTARRNNYAEKHGFKSITRPQYLSLVNQLEDAIRVADKMLNTQVKGVS